jgi:hypothetical protein
MTHNTLDNQPAGYVPDKVWQPKTVCMAVNSQALTSQSRARGSSRLS